ncbi:MAG: nickel pincer cofactor biosynthesis protein LarC [Bacteroidaceae bacterium]|nr:nickel pincer cofactor biosynthesis protein LarC [Bacteroidaceae bacterium]
MNKKLYLECYSGISGDMTVAALLDLGADADVLDKALKSLPLTGFETRISRVFKAGIDACDFNVLLEHDNHDHDMDYLHGDGHHHHKLPFLNWFHHHHDHDHQHSHTHAHVHSHSHQHEHRGLADIEDILNRSALSERAKGLAIRIFQIIAEAESKAHGLPLEEVHFHEVGAVDSIVDIAAVAVCLDNLDITEVIVPVLYEGTGTVRCQHGVLPIPVPAVVNIADAYGLNLNITSVKGEFITPTGAAIVAAIRTTDTLPAQFRILKTGLGAGKRNYNRPSMLRAMLIEETVPAQLAEDQVQPAPQSLKVQSVIDKDDMIVKLETNIDDCTGEALGFVMERLLEAGARDVHYFPVFMKKNRPGYQLNVICKEEQRDVLQRIIFEHTTTIGIRIVRMERAVLPRDVRKITTSLGEARVKVCKLPNGDERCYPEYDDVAALCQTSGKSFLEVFNTVYKESNG